MIAFIRLFGGGKARILAHCPQTRAIHTRTDATGKWEFTGVAQACMEILPFQILFRWQIGYGDIRAGCKARPALASFFTCLTRSRIAPLVGALAHMLLHKLPSFMYTRIIA